MRRNGSLRCGDRVFRLGHKSMTAYPPRRDLKITRAQHSGFPVIVSDPAFRRGRQSYEQLKAHCSTPLRMTLDEIAAARKARLAMTVPWLVLVFYARFGPPGHNLAHREIRTQRNGSMMAHHNGIQTA